MSEGRSESAGRRPVVGIMGAGEPTAGTLEAARRLGRLAAEAGWIVLTGGRPEGVMEAACAGAKTVPGSLTIGILPTGPSGPVGRSVDVAVFTDLGNARNVINVLSSDVVVACGMEGPGTASEVALAIKTGRPTVLLGASSEAARFFRTVARHAPLLEAGSPEDAISLVRELLADRGASV